MPKVAAPQAAAVRPSGGAPGRHRLPGAPDAGATSHRQAADSPLVTAPPAATTATVSPPSPSAPPGAPARTGSPIIEPGIQPALITAGLCLLLGLTAGLSRPGLAVAAVLLQAVTAAGVFRLNGMWPARQGIALAFAGGLTADVVMLALDGEHAPAVAIGTLGVWFLLVLVLQLRHRGGPDERLYALTVTMTSATATVLASGLVAAWSVGAQGSEGEEWATGAPVLIGVAAVGAAVLVRALPLPLAASVAASLAAATGAGAIAGGYVDVGAGGGALTALPVGCAALIGHRLASYDFPSRFVHFTAGVSLPLAVAAPVVYVMGRVVAG
ncbi:hypothetical protein AQ490_02540 [Wenjunlia vitaminophila]|uniref:Uncharacterized protein n=2 Tax=Wenjunlia vitaminophila TaxID=76728 RepID=A0A0T6LYA1_WENVI|nr:hypothetical protein AQ490_02540 [Wenjunlia vitaminophila]